MLRQAERVGQIVPMLFFMVYNSDSNGGNQYNKDVKNKWAGHFFLGGSSRRIKVNRIQPVSIQKPHIKNRLQ